jgi:hypothetical protein
MAAIMRLATVLFACGLYACGGSGGVESPRPEVAQPELAVVSVVVPVAAAPKATAQARASAAVSAGAETVVVEFAAYHVNVRIPADWKVDTASGTAESKTGSLTLAFHKGPSLASPDFLKELKRKDESTAAFEQMLVDQENPAHNPLLQQRELPAQPGRQTREQVRESSVVVRRLLDGAGGVVEINCSVWGEGTSETLLAATYKIVDSVEVRP